MSRLVQSPPPELAEQLAVELLQTSVHEAGHALVTLLLGVPLHEVTVGYRRRAGWLASSWSVVGFTAFKPGNRKMVVVDVDPHILIAAAGMEAEALWLVERDRCSLRAARKRVAQVRVHQRGDLADLREYCGDPSATLTAEQAANHTHILLCQHWPAVMHIADQLVACRRLSGEQVAQFI